MHTYTSTHIFSRALCGFNECENVFIPIHGNAFKLCVCVYIYIYIYIYTHTHNLKALPCIGMCKLV